MDGLVIAEGNDLSDDILKKQLVQRSGVGYLKQEYFYEPNDPQKGLWSIYHIRIL